MITNDFRDLKPANILLNNDTLKICDFGLSKKVNNLNVLNSTVTGTAMYMSSQILKH